VREWSVSEFCNCLRSQEPEVKIGFAAVRRLTQAFPALVFSRRFLLTIPAAGAS
jgi:hypothetical protein